MDVIPNQQLDNGLALEDLIMESGTVRHGGKSRHVMYGHIWSRRFKGLAGLIWSSACLGLLARF